MIRHQLTLFEAHARTGDPDTSHDAAGSIDHLTRRRAQALDTLEQFGPMTDEALGIAYRHRLELGEVMPQSPSGLRTRRSELVTLGLVVDTGDRVTVQSGRRAIVWGVA